MAGTHTRMKRSLRKPHVGTFRHQIRRLLLFALFGPVAYPAHAWAQGDLDQAERPVADSGVAMRDHLIVYVELVDTDLSQEDVHAALEEEFKIPVVAAEEPAGLQLKVRGRNLSASFENDDGTQVERDMRLPEDRAQQLVTISLLSGSIARDEAGALLARLRTPAPELPPLPPAEANPPEGETPEVTPPQEKPVAPQLVEDKGQSRPEPTAAKKPPAKNLLPPLPSVPASAAFTGSISYPTNLSKKKTHLHVGVVSSDIGSLEGVSATLLAHRNRGTDQNGAGSGVQLALAFLHTGGDFRGVNASALVASGSERLDGAIAAGLFSLQRGDVQGAQLSGLASAGVGYLQGLQMGGLGTFQIGKIEGFQGAGLSSFATGDIAGFQAAGVASISGGQVDGAQMATLAAYAHRGLSGYQMSFVNIARQKLDGMQLGLLNIAGDFEGTQLGLINIGARGKGTQVALVNIAKDLEGAAIAPINIIPGIRNQLLTYLSYSPSERLEGTPQGPLLHLAVKFLPGTVYTQLGFALGFESEECVPAGTDSNGTAQGSDTCFGDGIVYAPSFAIGARSRFTKAFYLDVDGQYQFVRGFNDSRSALHQLLGRAAVGVEITENFGFLAGGGPLLNFYEGPRVSPAPEVSVGWHAFAGMTFF